MVTPPDTSIDQFAPHARHFRALGWQVDTLTDAGAAVGSMRQLLAREDYGIIHVHSLRSALVASLALAGLRRTRRSHLVLTADERAMTSQHPLVLATLQFLQRSSGAGAIHLIVTNRAAEVSAVRCGWAARRVHVIPGLGIDTRAFRPDGVPQDRIDDARARLLLGVGEPYLLADARRSSRLQHREVLQAFTHTGRSFPRARLVLLAEEGTAERLRRVCRQSRISEKVRLVTDFPDLPALIKGAAAVLPGGDRVSPPRSLLHAMSLGVPIVTARTPALQELMDGECGWFVHAGDAAGLARCLHDVLALPEEVARRTRNARVHAGQYDERFIIALHETVYSEVLHAARLADHHALA